MATKQYNKNVFGYDDVVCGEPCEAKEEVKLDQTIKIQYISRIASLGTTVSSLSGIGGTEVALMTFRLPQPEAGYKILSVNYTITVGNNNNYYSQSDIYDEGNINLPGPSNAIMVDFFDTEVITNLTNNSFRIKLITGLETRNNNIDVKMYAAAYEKRADTPKLQLRAWDLTEPYGLEGFYVLEKEAERERRDIEEEPNPNRSY